MTARITHLTGIERYFSDNEIIVSKTDEKGRLIYVNDTFLNVSGYVEEEMLGQPHSCIRHPSMPRCVFKLLWDTISSGKELFAYVNNCAKNGDNYWVFAHVTPTFDGSGKIIGYHSTRRVPRHDALSIIQPLYAQLVDIENHNPDRKTGMMDAHKVLFDIIAQKGTTYDQLMFTL